MLQSITGEVRELIASRCCSRRTRLTAFSREMPTDWRPTSLRNPERPDEYFTDDSAWEFIAKHLREGRPIEAIVLEQPAGKVGYVLKVPGCPPVGVIYIKLQLGADLVIGRSFHQSVRDSRADGARG